MNVYLIAFAAIIVAVQARPEPPSSSYGAPSGNGGGGHGNGHGGNGGGGLGAGSGGDVRKYIYVHAPPNNEHFNGGGPAQKLYKIIFVKAPSGEAPKVEEKTIVYVLAKKPQPDTGAPAKPEVYFIKYRTQDGGNGGNGGGNGGYSSGGGDVASVYGAPEPSSEYGAPSGGGGNGGYH